MFWNYWKGGQHKLRREKRERIRRDTDFYQPCITAGVLHTLLRIVSDNKHENKALEKMTTQTENSKWILIYAWASMDICLKLLQIFSCRHNSCTWRESPRTRRVSDRSEVLRAGRQELLLKIEIVGFSVPQSGKYLSDLTKVQCTMIPLSTRSCLKSNKLRPILNGQFCHAISKNIGLNLFGSKHPREILVFVILKL